MHYSTHNDCSPPPPTMCGIHYLTLTSLYPLLIHLRSFSSVFFQYSCVWVYQINSVWLCVCVCFFLRRNSRHRQHWSFNWIFSKPNLNQKVSCISLATQEFLSILPFSKTFEDRVLLWIHSWHLICSLVSWRFSATRLLDTSLVQNS